MSLREEHLRSHLTDGRWHDNCYFCRYRRTYGGTGVTRETIEYVEGPRAFAATAPREQKQQEAADGD